MKKQTFWARSARKKLFYFNPRREAPKKMTPGTKRPPKTFVHPQSYHVVSYRIARALIVSHHIVSCRIVSHRAVPHRIGAYRICTVLYRIDGIVSYRFALCACVCVLVHEGALAFFCACVGAFACICACVCAFASIFLHRSQGPSLIFPRDLASSFPGT